MEQTCVAATSAAAHAAAAAAASAAARLDTPTYATVASGPAPSSSANTAGPGGTASGASATGTASARADARVSSSVAAAATHAPARTRGRRGTREDARTRDATNARRDAVETARVAWGHAVAIAARRVMGTAPKGSSEKVDQVCDEFCFIGPDCLPSARCVQRTAASRARVDTKAIGTRRPAWGSSSHSLPHVSKASSPGASRVSFPGPTRTPTDLVPSRPPRLASRARLSRCRVAWWSAAAAPMSLRPRYPRVETPGTRPRRRLRRRRRWTRGARALLRARSSVLGASEENRPERPRLASSSEPSRCRFSRLALPPRNAGTTPRLRRAAAAASTAPASSAPNEPNNTRCPPLLSPR